jgi:hypothetical protein
MLFRSQREWFASRKAWLRGGIIGVVICAALYIFYLFLFSASGDGLGQEITIPAMITGHLFSLLSGFVVPYGLFCKKVPMHGSWHRDPVPGGIPCVDQGQSGYCSDYFMYPESSCADVSAIISFWVITILLFAIYFAVGAGITVLIEKRRKKKI